MNKKKEKEVVEIEEHKENIGQFASFFIKKSNKRKKLYLYLSYLT